MSGDVNKPVNSFMRWIGHFGDGQFQTTIKGSHRVPSCLPAVLKRYERKWRRCMEKRQLYRLVSL